MMLYIVAILFGVILAVLLCVQLRGVIVGYRKAIGTPWQRFLAAFSDSLTILWARVVAFGGALLTFATTALPLIDPTTSAGQAIAGLFNQDTLKYWVAGITVIGLITEWARRRPGSLDPILPPAQDKPAS